MAVSTKQSIIDCTISLAEKKPLKKITVGEIVKVCGITRNTFYYHFHDIYDVLDKAIREKLSDLENCDPTDDDQALFDTIEFMVSYKKVWRNLYKTLGQETLQRYIIGRMHNVFIKYINLHLGDYQLSEMDMGIITTYFEEALFGVLVRWIRGESKGDTPEEMHAITERIRVIFTGCLDLMIENIKKNPL
ncbi:MAG: TetR/AcrR family transcriptional regulator C-terminal domain-containing protein [Lachnospiraceae bacterium]|nr:TetR/AcrR family transcriptional regulator C-terminal domain-containing protein [Lachnospiraceae bacterium]